MLSLVLWRIRVTLNDGRQLVGQMLAFDRHMNLVLAECEEFRRIKPKKKANNEDEAAPTQELKRSLGLVILRGEMIVSLSVEGPPPQVDDEKKTAGVRSVPPLFSCYGSGFGVNILMMGAASTWARSRWTCRTRNGHDAAKYVALSMEYVVGLIFFINSWSYASRYARSRNALPTSWDARYAWSTTSRVQTTRCPYEFPSRNAASTSRVSVTFCPTPTCD